MRARGIALLSALMIIALLMVFAFIIVDLACFHYRSVQLQQEIFLAREAAQSGLSDVVRQLGTDPSYGTNGEVLSADVGSSHYDVTFSPGSTPYSVNNLSGFTAVPGYGGRSVPPNSAHIMVVGRSPAGQVRRLEAVVRLEAIPFPVESTASVTGDSIKVAGASNLGQARSGHADLPGGVYAGAGGAGSVTLTGASTVTGDVRTVGQAALGPGVQVGGQVINNSAPLQVPDLAIDHFDNSSTPGVTVLSSGNYGPLNPVSIGPGLPTTNHFTGPVYVDGTVNITGTVLFNQAYIYVANGGDFNVNGALLGQGSLFATGKTQFLGGSTLNNNQKIAIFSQGDLTITSGSYFQGVLYSHGKIHTGPGLQVLGAVMNNGGTLQMDTSASITHLPEYTAFASYWLGKGGVGAPVKLIYWGEVP